MTDVAALVANDHAYLRQLFEEIGRAGDTPGVRPGLIRQLVAAWATHAAAERSVVFAEAASMVGSDLAGRAERVEHVIDRLLSDLRGDATDEQLRAVRELFESHVALVDGELLGRLREVAPDRLGELARRWAEATEATSGRVRPSS